MAITMKYIMQIYGMNQQFKKSDKFAEEAQKFYVEVLGEEPVHREWI